MQGLIKYFKQLVVESAVYGFAGIISRFVTFFTVPIFTRIFSPSDYGVISLITNSIAFLTILVVLGLDGAAHRWYWNNEDIRYRKTTLASWAWCQIFFASLLFFLLFYFSHWIGDKILNRSDGWIYFRLSAIILFLSVFTTLLVNWLRMQRRPYATICFSLGVFILNVIISIILIVCFHRGVRGMYEAQLIASLCAAIIAVLLMKSWINPIYFKWGRLKEMFRYSAPMIPAGISFWLVNLSGCYFIRYFCSMVEVGLYQIGITIATVVALTTEPFQKAWGPFAISIHKQPDAKEVYAHTLLIYLWITCLISTALFLFAPEILTIFTTKAYIDARWVVGILAFNYVIIGLGYIAALGSNLAKTTKPIGIAMTISAMAFVALSFLLVPLFGKEGSAIAVLLSQSFVPIYVFYHSQKLYPIPFQFGKAAMFYVFALASAICGSLISFNNLLLNISIKIVILLLFIPMLFVFKIVNFELLKSLYSYIKKQFLHIINLLD